MCRLNIFWELNGNLKQAAWVHLCQKNLRVEASGVSEPTLLKLSITGILKEFHASSLLHWLGNKATLSMLAQNFIPTDVRRTSIQVVG